MKEFFKLTLVGIISGLAVLAVGWYCSDLRDSLKLGVEVANLKDDINTLKNQISGMGSKLNDLSVQFARIDERTKVTSYNQQKFNQVVEQNKIPQLKVDSAKKFLNSIPSTKDAMNYLEMNLGFSPEDAKAVIAMPQGVNKKK